MSETNTNNIVTSPKSGVTTLLLCLFLGALGAHRFYVGRWKTAILMLLTAGGFGIWTLIDMVLIACCEFNDAEGRAVMFARNGSSPVKLVLGIIALGICIIVLYVVLLFGLIMFATSGVTDAVSNQLAALRAGDYEKAYSYTSSDFRRETSFEDFKGFVDQVPALKDNASSSFPSRSMENNEGAVTGTVTAKDGSVTRIEYKLIYEKNTWKIEGIRLNPSDSDSTKSDDNESSEDAASVKSDEVKPVASASAANSDKYLTYSEPAESYSIKYPNNWYFEQSDKTSVMFSGKKGTPSYYATVTIQMLPMKNSGGIYGSVKDVIDDLKSQITEKTTDVKFVSEGDAELPKNPKEYTGSYFVVSYTYKGEAMKKMQFIMMKPDGTTAYSWGYTTPASRYEADLSIAQAMYESWVIH